MKIAIAQLNPTVGDLKGNSQQILTAAQKAIETDCNLLLTTELALTGYPPRDLLMRPSFIQATTHQLQQLAKNLPSQLAVLVGTVEPNSPGKQRGERLLYNSAALLHHGIIQQYFQKRLLPTYDVFDEDRYFEAGKDSHWFNLTIEEVSYKIGVTICEDLWNDEEFWGHQSYRCNPLIELVQQDIDFVVNLSASPYQAGKQKLRQAMLGHSAKRYRIPIVYANQIGGNDDLIFDGCSFVLNRKGKVIQFLSSFQTDFAAVEWDKQQQDFKENNKAKIIESIDQEIWSALVLGVKDYVKKCGFSKVILGLSGGIDSALVAAVASVAIGAENVLGILMPSPYSSEHSIEDGLALANNLGIQTQIIPIAETMSAMNSALEPLFKNTEFGIAEENIQSRIRGTLLMGISNKFGHLLLSTGNKSEMAVGYCTLYGDMNGGLAVIADVPKTRVYSICRWLNQSNNSEIIPENVITKPASAELKPGQVDQDSLPSYEVLDDILYRLIEKHQSPQQIVTAGHEQTVVEKVVKLVLRAEFKRRQAPPGLKISDRAFGTGWRMPIAKIVSEI
ncbi:MAG: NAD+ synthase [Microcoleaceae cyanobacterium]